MQGVPGEQKHGSQASSYHHPAIPRTLKSTHLAEAERASREGLPSYFHETFKRLIYETVHS